MVNKKKSWKCPICGRNFVNTNQIHSCETYSIKEHHFKNDLSNLYQLYIKIIHIFHLLGPIEEESLKNIILIKKKSQFLSIQVQKSSLKLIFRTYSAIEDPRVKYLIFQNKLYYYQINLTQIDDIDDNFIIWLKNAYNEN